MTPGHKQKSGKSLELSQIVSNTCLRYSQYSSMAAAAVESNLRCTPPRPSMLMWKTNLVLCDILCFCHHLGRGGESGAGLIHGFHTRNCSTITVFRIFQFETKKYTFDFEKVNNNRRPAGFTKDGEITQLDPGCHGFLFPGVGHPADERGGGWRVVTLCLWSNTFGRQGIQRHSVKK